ncbi:ParB/RepB/Spo0J family partition protein [Nostoc sp. LEGE 06077]|uniref:ParB/RepB/Spo0J family partition protein n=1 Tax=Nostoc sp. LEGE 06077 TaxID=915325 RepID=UPI0018820237|nr:ParB/RepB/Spo0J family partition protein [Nostoc sp. LEGE 06077]MBE9209750.1 ParB/RepB/Spo0J family partition protein [Nostoc sp. LEGE 06077]
MQRKQTKKTFAGQITTPPPAPWLDSPDGDTAGTTETTVKLEDIVLPQHQPRRYFDPQALKELVESVKQHGILQPLLVRPLGSGKYELVAGERRYRAGQEVKLETVPVVVRELSDDQAFQLALIENLQREDLNPVEETEGILHLLAIRLHCDVEAVKSLLYRMKNAHSKEEKQPTESLDESRRNVSPNLESTESLDNISDNLDSVSESRRNVSPKVDLEQSKTVEQVFESLGLMNWLSFTTKRLPLLNLPEDILMALRQGKLEYTKAQALARVKDEEVRKQLLSQAIANDWSLSQIKEQIIANTSSETPPASKTPNQIPDRLKDITQRIKKRQLWKEPKKQKQLVNLINKLEALLTDE